MEKWIEEKVKETFDSVGLTLPCDCEYCEGLRNGMKEVIKEAYEKGVKERYVYNARRSGKQLLQMGEFIQAVRMGKKPLIIGLDYVVMSKEMFNKLNQEQGGTIIE